MSNGKKERTEDEKVELRGMIVCYTLLSVALILGAFIFKNYNLFYYALGIIILEQTLASTNWKFLFTQAVHHILSLMILSTLFEAGVSHIHFVVLMVIINYTWNGIVSYTSHDNDKK